MVNNCMEVQARVGCKASWVLADRAPVVLEVCLHQMQAGREALPRRRTNLIHPKIVWVLQEVEAQPDSSKVRCKVSLKDKGRVKEGKAPKVRVSMERPGLVEPVVLVSAAVLPDLSRMCITPKAALKVILVIPKEQMMEVSIRTRGGSKATGNRWWRMQISHC